MNLPRIGITMGDPAGVGPELCARILVDDAVTQTIAPVIFGSGEILIRAASQIGIELPELATVDDALAGFNRRCTLVDLGECEMTIGQAAGYSGAASFNYVQAAISSAIAGRIDAVVTNPINKQAWNLAGLNYPGHTELFAQRCDNDRFCMMMHSPAFSVAMATTHIGLADVACSLSSDRILEVIELAHDAIRRTGQNDPRLVVLGLNPHAGEQGLMGHGEEETIIQPAIDAARSKGIALTGPLPPDTAFLPAWREKTDCYICMYHDQALIPFKAFNFDTGVNVTLGLPIIRTSVDHGTAFDIAWQGLAVDSSLKSAIALAAQLAR